MASLTASARGLEIVDRARKKKGWTKTVTLDWWETALTSQATLRRFWRGQPIQRETFIKICEAVGVGNWHEIVDSNAKEEPEVHPIPIQDWSAAPDIGSFYGRTEELVTLKQWIIAEGCRLVTLSGMGGIGKTALAAMLAEEIQDDFDYLIWRSLRASPPVEEFLTDLIGALSNQQETDLPNSIDRMVSRLIDYLKHHRCLIVLDEVEAILDRGKLAGQYRSGYEDYGKLFRQFGEVKHNSCLVLTSWENPKIVAALAEKTHLVRCLQLTGLKVEEASKILREKGLSKDENKWETLNQLYSGNPLALKMMATTIKEFFNGSVAQFLEMGTIVIGDIGEVLYQQFERISELEKQLMYRMAACSDPMSLNQLAEVILPDLSKSGIIEALESLNRRSLIEKIPGDSEVLFTLQPVVRKYVQKLSGKA
ncbi:NB-ARC domain-containing protein [Microseira wollei]|uniref:WD-40 repeat-containing protein n=1 Tax=Microseira wollei NIES-4236 TaxID=2530354 RepID=A0AAV3XBG8_9CYAN|nr:NB-ARC domain-containing protein [Microseira wollei]GET37450.1 WD-40 repeat-containing protein [Microseira wollei NIES-4236]